MNLKDILGGMEYRLLKGSVDIEVSEPQYDSRKIKAGDVFFCIEGFNVDGHKYIKSALEKGAVAIVCTKVPEDIPDCTIIIVEDGRRALALASANYYDHPADKMKIIGITGTNGKTTSAFMLKSILEQAGFKVGLLGTIANYIGQKKVPATRTTPESLELHQLFAEMVEQGVDYCVMEVSSHSLSLDRVYGIKFSQGIFTNLTQDHLDFHKTFENYYEAKLILFSQSENSIINIDDEYGNRVYEDVISKKISCAIDKEAQVRGSKLNMHARGVEFTMSYGGRSVDIALNIPGKYNVMNAIGSAGACLSEGIDLEVVKKGLEAMLCVPGRCELVTSKYNLGYEVIVDYAHSPDGLENILKTTKEFTKNKLICVFGCGGDRDKTKRPIMGEIACRYSDFVVVTSDNPRSEEPKDIIKDIIQGMNKENYVVVEDRREGIKRAMELAQNGDIVVVAGKGHEDYQVLKNETIHFDEREIIAEIIKELF